jgi:hypothetical protein
MANQEPTIICWNVALQIFGNPKTLLKRTQSNWTATILKPRKTSFLLLGYTEQSSGGLSTIIML